MILRLTHSTEVQFQDRHILEFGVLSRRYNLVVFKYKFKCYDTEKIIR